MFNRLYPKGKFQIDLIWNFVAFFFIASGGILLNILIAWFYTPADLGVFNQCYAIFIIASQIAVIGVPPSVMKHTAEFADNREQYSSIILSGLIFTTITAIVVMFLLWWASSLISRILRSDGVGVGIKYLLPGIVFFSINKIFLNAFNGLRMMKLFAVLQSLRFIFMIIILIFLILFSFSGSKLTLIFSLSEFILMISCILFMIKKKIDLSLKNNHIWVKRHIHFGIKAFPAGLLSELNTRVDVLMLGCFASDRLVGIYSFSAMFAEGFAQLPGVVMRNSMPVLVPMLAEKKFCLASKFIAKVKVNSYMFFVPIAFIAAVSYPVWIRVITDKTEFIEGWPVFSIIIGCIALASGFLAFQNILIASGHPGWYSIMILMVVLINIVLNLILIPIMGMLGAALGTGCSILSCVFILRYLTNNIIAKNRHEKII